MCAVREVHSCNVHPSLDHFLGHLHRSRGRSYITKPKVQQLYVTFLKSFNLSYIKIFGGFTIKAIKHVIEKCLTNCADDASVARHGGFRVDVQQTHVFNEGVCHGSMQLLGMDDGA